MGTQQIVKACVKAQMREPDFYEQAGCFVARIWSKRSASVEEKQLTARQKEILAILKDRQLSPQEILSLLDEDISDRTLRRDLQLLKDEGYIENEGQLGPKTKWFISKTRT